MMKQNVLKLAMVVMLPLFSVSFASVTLAGDDKKSEETTTSEDKGQKLQKTEKLIKKADKQIDKGAIAESKGNTKKADKHYNKADDAMGEAEGLLDMEKGGVIDAACGNVGQPPC